jgi:hypothetical protein
MRVLPTPHLTVLAAGTRKSAGIFRAAKFTTKGVAGNRNPFVHTTPAFDPTAQQAAQKNCVSPRANTFQHVQGGR